MSVIEQQTPTITTAWQVDRVHSSAAFEVRHSGVAVFRGTFADLDATLNLDGGEPQFTGSVDVTSVQVPDEVLKGHLLSPDFFDAERHPEVRFVSSRVERGGSGSIKVEGSLTIRGHTEPLTASGRLNHVEADITGGERYGVELETTIDRTAYGINWNADLPNGGVAVANEVKLIVGLEFTPEA